jgi:hypothetical protein
MNVKLCVPDEWSEILEQAAVVQSSVFQRDGYHRRSPGAGELHTDELNAAGSKRAVVGLGKEDDRLASAMRRAPTSSGDEILAGLSRDTTKGLREHHGRNTYIFHQTGFDHEVTCAPD